jgi:hypothetical protein
MTDTVAVGHAAQPPLDDVADDVDMDNDIHKNSVHQRLRANSSIMQVKKLLGMSISHCTCAPKSQ